jgi:hypothetical protein
VIDQDKHLESESRYPDMRLSMCQQPMQGSPRYGMSQEEDTVTGSLSGTRRDPSLTKIQSNILAIARYNEFQISDQRARDVSHLHHYHPVSIKYRAFLQIAMRVTHFSRIAVPKITYVSETLLYCYPLVPLLMKFYCSLSAMTTPDTLGLQPVV